VDRKMARTVFGMVCLAALVATAANVLLVRTYLNWKTETSSCTEQLAKGELGLDRRAESVLKAFAATNNNVGSNEWWDFSVRAEGHALLMDYRFKRPMDTNDFNARVVGLQKIMREAYCAEGSWLLRSLKA